MAPSADFNATDPVREGDPIDLALTNVQDPGTADTHQYRFDCGNGFGAYGNADTISCPANDDGQVKVRGQVRDDDGSENDIYEKTVTVLNLLPTATDDPNANGTYVTDEDATLTVTAANGVLKNDKEPNSANDPLTARKVTDPAHGTVVLNPDGSFTYTPKPDYSGPDSFTYRACDDDGGCSEPATVNISVDALMADLDVRIDAPRSVTEGKPFPVTFTVTNKGPDTAKNAVLKTVLPGDVRLVSAPDNCRYDRDTRTLVCKLGDLADGAKKALEIKIKAEDADDLGLRATVDSDSSDPEKQNNQEAEAIEVKAAPKPEPNPEPKPESSSCREAGKGKTFSGTAGPDVMRGTPGDDTFFGFGGNDKIYGLGGEDSIIVGDGSDTICGGECSDSIDANDGNDFVYGEDGKDSLNGGDGNDRIYGGSGVDSFNGSGGSDRLYAKDGEKESVNGGSDRDRCFADKKDTTVNCP